MQKEKKFQLKNFVTMAMLCALAVVADMFLRIPGIGGFLTYEPKDVILTVSAFIFGPIAGIIMSLVVCLIEMVTVSSTGIIGLLMNFISSAVFIGVASFIYSRKKTLSRAIIGLVAALLAMTAVMLLWNYIITPVYMHVERSVVLGMILPLLLPFNLLKAGLNSTLTMFLYKGIVTALRKSKLIPQSENSDTKKSVSTTVLIVVTSAFLAVTLLLVILIFAGKIQL
ncbi:MAG: ECF transporter S component [Clostridiales bacterium]|nr:ECF transporter S component [Clostridiales bacterium]